MAVSPLYPGEIPDAQNPVYPGYYPGQPIQRKPPFRPAPPSEYTTDLVTNFIKNLDFDVTNVPNWIKEQLIADMKRQLTVTGEPREFKYDVQRALETGELDEAPGVQLSLSLDPEEWLKDPQKQLEKTLDKWKGSLFRWEDVDRMVQNQALWTPLIRGESVRTGLAPVDMFATEVYEPFKLMGYDEVSKPEFKKFFADGTRAAAPPGKGKELLYDKAGESFLKYTHKVDSLTSRKPAYSDIAYKAIAAVNGDIEHIIESNAGPVDAGNLAYFRAKVDIAGSMEVARGTPILPRTMPTVMAELDKIFLEGDKAVRKLPNGTTEKITIESVINKIYSGTPGFDTGGFVDNALKRLDDGIARVGTKGTPTFNADYAARLTDETKAYRKYLEDLKSIAENASKRVQAGGGNKADIRLIATGLKGTLALQRERFTSDTLDGIEDKFVYNFVRKEVFGGRKGEPVHNLIDQVHPHLSKGYDSMGRVLATASRMYDINEAQDFANIINKGEIMEKMVWKLVRTRLGGFTPAAVVGDAIKRVHYFGLAYDPEMAARNKRGAGILRHDPFGKLAPKHTISMYTGGMWRKFDAGDHFEGAMKIHDMMIGGDKDLGNFARDKTGKLLAPSATDMTNMTNVIDFLNKPGISIPVPAPSPAHVVGEIKKIENFKKWLEEHKAELGLSFDANGNLLESDENKKAVLAILTRLGAIEKNQNNISILFDRAGIMQHLASYANHIQTQISKVVAKVLAPYVVFRRALSELLAKLAANVSAWAIGALTVGAGAAFVKPITWIIERISKYIIGTIMNFVDKFASALVHLDFSGLIKDLEKTFNNGIRLALYVSVAPILLFIFVYYIFATLIGGTPSYNPGRSSGIYITASGDGSATGAQPPATSNSTACPLNDGRIGTGSLNGDSGHGSTSYWSTIVATGGNSCSFTIPFLADPSGGASSVCPNASAAAACSPTSPADNVCKQRGIAPQQGYYGYAVDVNGSSDTVYLPKLGNVEKWTVVSRVSIFGGDWGYGIIISGSDGSDDYKLYLGHVDSIYLGNGSFGNTGDAVAELFTGPYISKHIHIEVMKNGVPVKPESLGVCY